MRRNFLLGRLQSFGAAIGCGLILLIVVTEIGAEEEPEEYKTTEAATPQKYPGEPYPKDCKYDEPPFSDCDPFHLVRWRILKLISGPQSCQASKNETKPCSSDQFPPGTKWLVKEHKKCLTELEHLKGLLADLHRWIDVIHERGQALFKAFNELRNHLEDLQRQIKELHLQKHNNQVLEDRLKKELDEWRNKAKNIRAELDSIKAKYTQLQKEHAVMTRDTEHCMKHRDDCKKENINLNAKITAAEAENRELKTKLIHAERFKSLAEKAQARIRELEELIEKLKTEIKKTKDELAIVRIDILNAKQKRAPTYNRDTHVNLDMKMWITHNQTKEENYKAAPTYPTSPPYTYPAKTTYYTTYTKPPTTTTYSTTTYYTTTTPYTTPYTTTYTTPYTTTYTTTYTTPYTTTTYKAYTTSTAYYKPETTYAQSEYKPPEYKVPSYAKY